MDINVKGVWLGCRHGIPAMLESGGGSIINVASFVAHIGRGDAADRVHGVEGGGAGDDPRDRRDYARQGIRANALCPGPC